MGQPLPLKPQTAARPFGFLGDLLKGWLLANGIGFVFLLPVHSTAGATLRSRLDPKAPHPLAAVGQPHRPTSAATVCLRGPGGTHVSVERPGFDDSEEPNPQPAGPAACDARDE